MKHVTGTIIRAGELYISPDDHGKPERKIGFFVECSGKDILDIARLDMYNRRVAVILDRRKNRAEGPSFHRTVETRLGVKHADKK